jgi:hypothetical protein
MCNACGFFCCASDVFEGCGCDHCYCSECWSDDPDDDRDEEDYECRVVDVGDELHQILGEALKSSRAR